MKNTFTYNAIKMTKGALTEVSDILTIEHPLSISINDEPFTLTMQTPGNEMELARGLLFTEGVYKNRNSRPNMHVIEMNEQGFISKLNVEINKDDLDQSQITKRNLLSVASCGICGMTELSYPEGKLLCNDVSVLALADVQNMFDEMKHSQTAFLSSGGCHAASIFSKEKIMLTMQEDIGRHNAVDKVIGALLCAGKLNQGHFLLVSGRISYEIVTKCFIAGIPFLMAVSAPSSLAVDFAKELGITLMGFCREDRATVYSHPERLR